MSDILGKKKSRYNPFPRFLSLDLRSFLILQHNSSLLVLTQSLESTSDSPSACSLWPQDLCPHSSHHFLLSSSHIRLLQVFALAPLPPCLSTTKDAPLHPVLSTPLMISSKTLPRYPGYSSELHPFSESLSYVTERKGTQVCLSRVVSGAAHRARAQAGQETVKSS